MIIPIFIRPYGNRKPVNAQLGSIFNKMINFILDTNIYRTLVHGRSIEDLKLELKSNNELKKANGFKSIFPNIVAIELINHLLDSDGASIDCFKGLFYLIHDTRQNSSASFKGQVVPTIHDLATYYLFQQKSEHFTLNNNICHISHLIAHNGDNTNIKSYRSEIEQVMEFKRMELEGIIKNIEEHYLKPINNKGLVDWEIFDKNLTMKKEFKQLIKNKSFHQIFGFSLIQMAVNETKQEIAVFKMIDLENGMFKDFKKSIDFFVEHIWNKLIVTDKKEYLFNPETDPKKRWNSFYDLQLVFANEYENALGRKTALVTEEKRIRALFEKFGDGDLIFNLNGYKSLLKN
ncbi:MAG: hypothetical protein CMH46_10320 [Muricauda sp.]|nr:hypothetical protein [Allomuricauda sp.]|tara:strand:+ start:3918 stop:4958 length:1041 start_codon:yes stop_codon:yes gene_type:complete